jgi:hypothetical protein
MNRHKKIILWIPVVLIMVLIFFFSSQNADESSQTSGGLADVLAHIVNPKFDLLVSEKQTTLLSSCQHIVRKCAHFSIYAALGFFCSLALSSYKSITSIKRIPISLLICAAYALSDELHQRFVAGRSCELRDVIIDSCGALTGSAVFLGVFVIVSRFRKRRLGRL